MKPLRIAIRGLFSKLSSFAICNRALAREFQRRGHEIFLFPTDGPSLKAPELEKLRVSTVNRLFKNGSPPDVLISHEYPYRLDNLLGKMNIAVLPWEFFTLPDRLRKLLDKMIPAYDAFFVYSNHVRKIFRTYGVPDHKITAAPLGFDPQEFHPGVTPVPLPSRKRFKFLFAGAAEPRKGLDLLLRAYCEEFTQRDDVCLVIKLFSYKPYLGWCHRELKSARKIRKHGPEILFILKDQNSIAGYYTACDVGVFPFRAEGFCLPILEMMACGRPSILTNGTGPLDFCTESTSYLIPASPSYLPGRGRCLKPDLEELKRTMRFAYENRDHVSEKGKNALAHASQYTWANAADRWLREVKERFIHPSKKNGRLKQISQHDKRASISSEKQLNSALTLSFLPNGKNGFEKAHRISSLFQKWREKHIILVYFHPPLMTNRGRWQILQSRVDHLYHMSIFLKRADLVLTNDEVFIGLIPSSLRKKIVPFRLDFPLPCSTYPLQRFYHQLFYLSVNPESLCIVLEEVLPQNSGRESSEIVFPQSFFSPATDRRSIKRLRQTFKINDIHCALFETNRMRCDTLEAMSQKKVVIVSERSSLRLIIKNGFNGFVIPIDDIALIERTIRRLRERPAEVKRIGENARKTILAYKRKRFFDILCSTLNSLNHKGAQP